MIAPIEQVAGKKTALIDILKACEVYEAESLELEQMTKNLEADLKAVKEKHLAALKRKASSVATLQSKLQTLVECAPELFIKPRTITNAGIKVGYTSSPGSLAFDDEETVIKLIRKFHKEDSDTYIRTTEEVNKDAVKLLTADELARIGCRIEGAGDAVVLKRVAGDVEKIMNRLVNKMVESMTESE